jgi:hypothetical protein
MGLRLRPGSAGGGDLRPPRSTLTLNLTYVEVHMTGHLYTSHGGLGVRGYGLGEHGHGPWSSIRHWFRGVLSRVRVRVRVQVQVKSVNIQPTPLTLTLLPNPVKQSGCLHPSYTDTKVVVIV